MKSVDRTISRIIAPRMKQIGFSRRHNTWNRRLLIQVQVVNIQQSVNNTDDRVRFTVNLGQRLDIAPGEGAWVRATDCHPESRRLGFLTPAREDTWYRCDPSDPIDVDRAVRECLADLNAYGLPWLDGSPASGASHSPDAATRERTGDGSRTARRWIGWLRKHLASKK